MLRVVAQDVEFLETTCKKRRCGGTAVSMLVSDESKSDTREVIWCVENHVSVVDKPSKVLSRTVYTFKYTKEEKRYRRMIESKQEGGK